LRIRFLGSGGGRYVTAYQFRRTGGFLIEDGGLLVHVDPVPGAVRALKDFGEDVRKINGLIVSHAHPDHITDAPIVIEGITEGVRKKKGFLIGPETVIKGLDDYRPIGSYHLGVLEKIYQVKPGDTVDVGIEVEIIPAKHTEEKAVGFVWRGSRTITYYSDTGYWEEMEKYAEDIVIFNLEVIKDAPRHTHPRVVRRVLEGSYPKVVLLTHFGWSVLRYGPDRLAKEFEKEFGADVIAVNDGYEWRSGGKEKTLFDF
jgi:phosphoribosyl 1,2-cyclic phosphodiesterase